jgi:3-hydroxybutyryl-CoA dehydrogenase
VALGKTPVTVKDGPGFVSNRILMPMINEAAFALFENLATAEDIDTVMKLGMNHPIGPGAGRPDWPGHLPVHHGHPLYRIP